MSFSGQAAYDTYTSEGARSVSNLVRIVGLDDVPFLNALGDADYPVTNIMHEWQDHKTWYATDTVNDSGAFAAADTTLTVTDGTKFRAKMIIRIDEELIYVSTVATHNLTVIRGFGGTADAEHADGSTIYIQSHPQLEGSEWGDNAYTITPTQNYNYTQIIKHDVQISGSEMAMATTGAPGGKAKLNLELEKATRYALRQLERSVIAGGRRASSPQGSSALTRTLGGLHEFVTSSTDASTAALSESTHLDVAIQAIRELGGRPDMILAGTWAGIGLSRLQTPHRRAENSDGRIMRSVNMYDHVLVPGGMQIIVSEHCRPNELYVLDSTEIFVRPLQGRSFSYVEGAKTGDYEGGWIVGEYTLEVQNSGTHHYRIYGLATS